MDLILQYQGVGWFKRKAISLATLTLIINHYKDDGGVEHIDIDQSLSGGVGATTERRTLDWIERKHDDSLFGSVSRFNIYNSLKHVLKEAVINRLLGNPIVSQLKRSRMNS